MTLKSMETWERVESGWVRIRAWLQPYRTRSVASAPHPGRSEGAKGTGSLVPIASNLRPRIQAPRCAFAAKTIASVPSVPVFPGSYVEYVQKLGHEAPGIYS